MTDTDNIIRLAELQDSGGGLPQSSEDALALMFAERHAGHLRYVAAWAQWLDYGGGTWCKDDTLHVFDRAREICREVAMAYAKTPGALTAAKTVVAVERLARSDRRLAATAEQWDADPWLVNIQEEEKPSAND